jgi:hypothetical protein
MNAGQRINLRLRPPGSPDRFYEFDQLVLVMLHEVGPFYLTCKMGDGRWKMENGTDDSLLISNLVRMILRFISYLQSWRRNITS